MTWPSPHMFFVHVHQSSKSFGRTTSAFLRSFSRCTWDRRVFNQRTPETPRHSQDGNLGVRRVLALAASTSFQNPANLPTPANSKGFKCQKMSTLSRPTSAPKRPSFWTSCSWISKQKCWNLASETLSYLGAGGEHFYGLLWWDRDPVVCNNKCDKRW